MDFNGLRVTRKVFVNKMREIFIVEKSHWPMNKDPKGENEIESKFTVCGGSRDLFSFNILCCSFNVFSAVKEKQPVPRLSLGCGWACCSTEHLGGRKPLT